MQRQEKVIILHGIIRKNQTKTEKFQKKLIKTGNSKKNKKHSQNLEFIGESQNNSQKKKHIKSEKT